MYRCQLKEVANGLPEKIYKIKETNMKKDKKLMVEFINHICEKNYSSARKSLASIVNEKVKDRIQKTALATK